MRRRTPPGTFAEAALGMAASRCLYVAARIGLFEALEAGPRELAELARTLGCDPAGLRVLVRALADVGLVRLRGELASATRHGIARELLLFLGDVWRWLGELEDRVRRGGTDAHHAPQPDGFRERYDGALRAALGDTPEELARVVPVTRSPERLLDVGGGHGLVAEAFRVRHPGLRADVLDLTLPERAVDGVTFREGDLRTSDWGAGYDVVLLSLVLRHLSPDECADALRRAAAALRPGGTVAVIEPRAPTARRGEGLREVFHWLASGRPAHTTKTLRGWLAGARLGRIRTVALESAPASVLLVGLRT